MDDLRKWCYDALKENDWCILDTETTGLGTDDEIIEIAIIANDGAVLLNQMIRPFRQHMDLGAQRAHGITMEDLKHKPAFAKVLPQIVDVLQRYNQVVVYNAAFDNRLFRQSVKKAGAQVFMSPGGADLLERSTAEQKYYVPLNWICLMEKYAEFWGEPGRHGGYGWQRLQEACRQQDAQVSGEWHRALGDCQATLALIKSLAEQYERQEAETRKRPIINIDQARATFEEARERMKEQEHA